MTLGGLCCLALMLCARSLPIRDEPHRARFVLNERVRLGAASRDERSETAHDRWYTTNHRSGMPAPGGLLAP
jgi:hypothetical protein